MPQTMAYARYESIRDSGLPWLGTVPAHWQLEKTKYLWRELEERSIAGKEQLLSVSQYYGVVPKEDDSRSESLIDYKRCRKQDLVVNIMLAWMGGLGVTDHDGIVSPAYCVYRQLEGHNSKYFNYLYRTPLYLSEFAKRSKGIVPSRWRMYTEDFGQVISLLPPRDEQDRIVIFLDQKTAEIDEIIAKKRRLIELLKEQKVISINQAVTKGLNPDVSMRDSGVEWIGVVPTHWEVKRLKYLIKRPLQYGANEEAKNCVEGDPRYIRITDFSDDGLLKLDTKRTLPVDKSKGYFLNKGDILFARSGATVGKTFLFDSEEKSCFAGYLIRATTDNSKIDPMYLYLYTKSSIFCYWRDVVFSKSTIQNIGADKYATMPVVVPPLTEQTEIMKHIDILEKDTNPSFVAAQKHIDLLNEMKQILIDSAVTGKIKI